MKEKKNWTLKALKEKMIERLAPDWDATRLEKELYKLQVGPTDDPDDIMDKIEKVLIKRSEDVTMARARIMQHTHFMRLIMDHGPMHNYVINKSTKDTDPDEAAKLARQYLKKKGNTVDYFKKIVSTGFTEAGVTVPASIKTDTVLPTKTEASVATVPKVEDQVKPGATVMSPPAPVGEDPAIKQLQHDQKLMLNTMTEFMAKVDKLTTTKQPTTTNTQTDVSETLRQFADYQQFIKRGTQLDMDEIVRRFNQEERLMRDLRVAGLPDYMKKKVNEQMYTPNKSNDDSKYTQKSKYTYNNDFKPKDRYQKTNDRSAKFEKGKKGKQKRYKRQFVPEKDGKFVAQFETDSSEEESDQTNDE
jgi:hypothetical protein